MRLLTALTLGSILLFLSACSSTGPIVYPNTHFLAVGKAAAEKDIEVCRKLAESAGAREGGDGKLGNVATSTAMGAGIGAASGAAGGAIYGAAGQGSLVGAASGAVAGLLRGVLFSSRSAQPGQAYVNFVSRCLEEKGYEITGWQ
ncbi:MAG: hypothetical protein HRU78_02775 [Gammaproteobacteria bacterium]|nr:MAG: hypothetical protein HRU78_02775 [Gammaproteobacteria bacterium]